MTDIRSVGRLVRAQMSADDSHTRVGFLLSCPTWRIPLADIRSVGKLVRPQMSSDDSLTRVGSRARVHPSSYLENLLAAVLLDIR